MSEQDLPTAETGPAATPPPPPTPGPGTLLRQARERAGLGAEDLAGQLKIASSTLEALERDDFAALSEPVYVRGYYRKIARVLSVPEQEVIDAYNRCSRAAPAAAAAPAMGRIPLAGGVAAGTSRQYRGQGLWLVGIAVVAAAALFALARREPVQRIAPAGPTTLPAAPTVPVESAPAESTMPTPAAVADGVAGGGSLGADPDAADTGADVASASPSPVAPVPPNRLVLEFSEASFVRIEDSRAQTMAIGLVRGGERQALEGVPPYTVFLGNAHNVKVFYGGAPVDFTAHINRQNDTARFTVP